MSYTLWQSMDSAPKDGSLIIIKFKHPMKAYTGGQPKISDFRTRVVYPAVWCEVPTFSGWAVFGAITSPTYHDEEAVAWRHMPEDYAP